MKSYHPYIFVFWSNNFDELSAATFISEMRRDGLCVRIIGLGGQQGRGENGLCLNAELTLSQALPLAKRASCVVLPCPADRVARLEYDPRLTDFFRQAKENRAKFITGPMEQSYTASPRRLSPTLENVTFYPESTELVKFVREISMSLREEYFV